MVGSWSQAHTRCIDLNTAFTLIHRTTGRNTSGQLFKELTAAEAAAISVCPNMCIQKHAIHKSTGSNLTWPWVSLNPNRMIPTRNNTLHFNRRIIIFLQHQMNVGKVIDHMILVHRRSIQHMMKSVVNQMICNNYHFPIRLQKKNNKGKQTESKQKDNDFLTL